MRRGLRPLHARFGDHATVGKCGHASRPRPEPCLRPLGTNGPTATTLHAADKLEVRHASARDDASRAASDRE